MKSHMKKLCSLTAAAALMLGITAFSVTAMADEASDTETVTGKITAISGTKVTLEIRDMPENGRAPQDQSDGTQTPPEKPEGLDTTTPPEKPNDDNTAVPPQQPGSSGSMTPPEKPSGSDTAAPPEKPQGSSTAQQPTGTPPQKPDDSQESPEDDAENLRTVTVDLSGTSVDVSSLKVGDMLTVELSGSKALSASQLTPPEQSDKT